nr:DivIVA domain protein [Streptomyces tsukubensis NRRL18488]
MFLFLLIAMVVVVGAVTLAVLGGGDSAALPEAAPERLVDPLPESRPVGRADVEALRLPVAARGYRMADVDDALARLGAELAERDARIARLESALAGARATAVGGRELFAGVGDPGEDAAPGAYDVPEHGPHAGPGPDLDTHLDTDLDLDPDPTPDPDRDHDPEPDRNHDPEPGPDAGADGKPAGGAVRDASEAEYGAGLTAPEPGGTDTTTEGRDR